MPPSPPSPPPSPPPPPPEDAPHSPLSRVRRLAASALRRPASSRDLRARLRHPRARHSHSHPSAPPHHHHHARARDRHDLLQTLLTFPEHDAATVAALLDHYHGDRAKVVQKLHQYRRADSADSAATSAAAVAPAPAPADSAGLIRLPEARVPADPPQPPDHHHHHHHHPPPLDIGRPPPPPPPPSPRRTARPAASAAATPPLPPAAQPRGLKRQRGSIAPSLPVDPHRAPLPASTLNPTSPPTHSPSRPFTRQNARRPDVWFPDPAPSSPPSEHSVDHLRPPLGLASETPSFVTDVHPGVVANPFVLVGKPLEGGQRELTHRYRQLGDVAAVGLRVPGETPAQEPTTADQEKNIEDQRMPESEAVRVLLARIRELEASFREFERETVAARKELVQRLKMSELERRGLEQMHAALRGELDENHKRAAVTEQYLDTMRRDLGKAIGNQQSKVSYIARSTLNNALYYILAYLVPVVAFLIRGGRDMVNAIKLKMMRSGPPPRVD